MVRDPPPEPKPTFPSARHTNKRAAVPEPPASRHFCALLEKKIPGPSGPKDRVPLRAPAGCFRCLSVQLNAHHVSLYRDERSVGPAHGGFLWGWKIGWGENLRARALVAARGVGPTFIAKETGLARSTIYRLKALLEVTAG